MSPLKLIDTLRRSLLGVCKTSAVGKFRLACAVTVVLPLIMAQPVAAHGVGFHEFSTIDRRLGLDASQVNCVVQDYQGLMWFGTTRGLYSFDGFAARQHVAVGAADWEGFDEVVHCALMVDSALLWLGTDNGLLIFNTLTDRYEPTPAGMPKDIRAIARINDHSFWLGSMGGLFRYDVKSLKIERIDNTLLPHQAIYAILPYGDGRFYFGTYDGLCSYDGRTDRFTTLKIGHRSEGSNQLVLSLLADYRRNCIWVGLQGELVSYFPSDGTSRSMEMFAGNSVKSLLIDNQSCLWVATDNGLYIYEPVAQRFQHFRHDALNDRSLVNNIVWSVFADREQNIWLGTETGVSLFSYNPRYKIQSVSELTGSNEGNHIISLLSDSKGNLWLGGTNGLIKIDPSRKNFVWYQQNSEKYPLPHNRVRHIYEDTDGDIWIATDGSLCRYLPSKGQFERYQIEDASHVRNANWAYAICQDETRKLWVATCLGGVFVVDKQKLLKSNGQTVVADRNYYVNGGVNSLSGNMLQFVVPDADHNMWAGTYKAGINKIDRQNEQVHRFLEGTGDIRLPSNDVTAMVAGTDNQMWVALRNRLVRLDTRTFKMTELSDARLKGSYISALTDDGARIWLFASDGMFVVDKRDLKFRKVSVGSNYYSSACYNAPQKKMVAGGINEYVEFDPATVGNESDVDRLFLTALWVNDRLVNNADPADRSPALEKSIRYTPAIELAPNQNNVAVSFSALRYGQGTNLQYAYKLVGLDDDWRYTSVNRVSYNNLRPGEYILQITCIDALGVPMTNPLTLGVKVNHPWYSTLTAKLIYSVLFVLLILAIANYFLVLNRLRYERLEKLKTLELTAHKIDFLTNISHELKTPLSLIIGPLGKIIGQLKTPVIKEQLTEVRQNAMRLNAMIHQLMEAGRQETDGFGLIVSKIEMVEFVRSTVSVFEKPLADKEVAVELVCNVPSLIIEGDVMKLESVLNNLLSNALKFAPPQSAVTVDVRYADNRVRISVADRGPGIPQADLPFVFDRFYQSNHPTADNNDGSGVGLSIVKSYTDLHHGTVTAFSEPGRGTRIEVTLPVKQMVGESDGDAAGAVAVTERAAPDTGKPLLLIVEDNHEILSFIANSLEKEFRCITAQNGKLGLDAALAHAPDIIVTDIMMPVMDGIDMCRKLKENIATSLTPIIMLTAKDDKATEMSSYSTGADAFISKPFEIGFLSYRLHQLLQSRKLLVQKARQEAIIKPKEMDVASPDEKFLALITQIIEDEVTHADLNVNLLSEKSGYNAKQVYRRIKALTGQTAVDYIRSVRLKKAAVLLSRKTFTVAEVMYMVGFNNHSYFAKRFVEMYGKSPKQYMDEGA